MTFLPIAERELRVAARKPLTFWTRWAAAVGCLILWFVMALANRRLSIAQFSQMLLTAFAVVVFAFALLSGIFLTSDCLSEEKREGTLGLLFLTDLKGHDIVVGKLVATSLLAFFAMLAVFPIMAVPLLMGGVSAGEFWRLVLVLIVTLFFSLGLGMFSSVLNRESRQSMAATLFALILLTAFLPGLWWLDYIIFKRSHFDWLLLPSPACAFRAAYDFSYRLSSGKEGFWLSLAAILFVGAGSFLASALLLPRFWQDKGTIRPQQLGASEQAAIHIRSNRCTASIDDPCFWLASRGQAISRLGGMAILVVTGFWACFLFASTLASRSKESFIISLFAAYALHQLAKYFMAAESTRQLNADRRSGALELLLVTPLPDRDILDGYASAFGRRFLPLLGLLGLVNASMCFTTFASSNLSMDGSDRAVFFELFLGGVVTLLLDFRTIGKTGVVMALRAKNHNRAILATLVRIMLPPWIGILLIVFVLRSSVNSAGAAAFVFSLWFGLGIITDFFFLAIAETELRTGIRNLLSASDGRSTTASTFAMPAALEPLKA